MVIVIIIQPSHLVAYPGPGGGLMASLPASSCALCAIGTKSMKFLSLLWNRFATDYGCSLIYYFFINSSFGFWISSLKLIIRPHGWGPWDWSLSKKIWLIYSKTFSLPASAWIDRIIQEKSNVCLLGYLSSLTTALRKHNLVSSLSLCTIYLKV